MQAIKKLETTPRGAYCGALGIVEPTGNALFSVGIRSVTINRNTATCGIGSGITWDSKANEELAENQVKQRFLWRASAGFDLLETIRLEDGQFWLLERHLTRMQDSAKYFGFMFDVSPIQQALHTLAKEKPDGTYRVRLLVSRKGSVKTEAFILEQNPELAMVALAQTPIDGDNEFLHHKTTNRSLYDMHTPTDTNIFDTLLYNQHDEITEFTRGNIVIELNNDWITPPLSCGVLNGTYRTELLAEGKIMERIITRDDLHHATNLWFLNGLRGMIKAKLVA